MTQSATATSKTSEKKKVKVLIPLEDLIPILERAMDTRRHEECSGISCTFRRSACGLDQLLKEIRTWWKKTNGESPGFVVYEEVVKRANTNRDQLFWDAHDFRFDRDRESASRFHRELTQRVKARFQ
jgi:hypothetical protein